MYRDKFDGWAFSNGWEAKRDADTARLTELRAIEKEHGLGVKREPNPAYAHTDYKLTIEGPGVIVRGLSVRDCALFCDSNLCFGGGVDSDGFTDLGEGRVRRSMRLTVHTD